MLSVFLFRGNTMSKIIFTSRYLRDAPPKQLEKYVRYASTREGVEKVEGEPATEDLENGFDTLIGESGMRLPGGQRQSLAIARLFLQYPEAIGVTG